MWILGDESIIGKVDILFGIKCIFEGQLYYFDKKKFKINKKIFKLIRGENENCYCFTWNFPCSTC